MKLGKKQELFVRLIHQLKGFIFEQGYDIREGDAFRDPRVHGEWGEKKGYGSAYSVHKLKLANDINLFKDGMYLTKTEDHKVFGEYWESLHPLCRWGGRWNDGNHYSLEHEGKK